MTRRRFSARALTARLLEFDGKCADCGCKVGLSAGLDWDHILPLAMGGDDEIENLQPLCKNCHKAKTKVDKGHMAKAERMQQRAKGIRRQSRNSFQTNRDGPFKKKLDGTVVRR